MLRLDRIVKRSAGVTMLQDVSLHVGPGEWVGIAGPPGHGRSTLLRVAATLTAPDSGDVFVNGIDVRRDLYRARVAMAYVGEPAQAPPGLQVDDYIRAAVAGRTGARDYRFALDAVSQAGLGPTSEVAGLSAAARWRLALAAALAGAPRLLLLDDPFRESDDAWMRRALEWIVTTRDNGAAVLIASDAGAVERLCSRVVRVEAGRLSDRAVPHASRSPEGVDAARIE